MRTKCTTTRLPLSRLITIVASLTLVGRVATTNAEPSITVSSSPSLVTQSGPNTEPVGLFNWSNSADAALSADGRLVAYVTSDGIHIRTIDTNFDRRILKPIDEVSEFEDLSFSPDGQSIAFIATGPSWYYSSVAYTVRIDGTMLSQLTTGAPLAPSLTTSNQEDAFGSGFPVFSPNGSQLAIWIFTKENEYFLGLIAANDQHQVPKKVALIDGVPQGFADIFWNSTGDALYYPNGDQLMKLSIATGKSQVITKEQAILGKVPGMEAVFINDGNHIAILNLQTLSENSTGVGANLRAVMGRIALQDSDGRELKRIFASNSGRLLLTYEADIGSSGFNDSILETKHHQLIDYH